MMILSSMLMRIRIRKMKQMYLTVSFIDPSLPIQTRFNTKLASRDEPLRQLRPLINDFQLTN